MIQFRGSEVIELQHFEPASTDDITSVHARAYVYGLEKVTFFVKQISLLHPFHMREAVFCKLWYFLIIYYSL